MTYAELVAHAHGDDPAPLFRSLSALAKNYSAPIWWRTPDQQNNSASMTVIDTGVRVIAATAAHVHRAAIAVASEGNHIQIGMTTFDPQARLIDIDDTMDLATYDVRGLELAAFRSQPCRLAAWPVEGRREGACIAGGWPWRPSVDRPASRDLYFLHFFTRLGDDTHRAAVFAIDRKTSIAWDGHTYPATEGLGGMSGGPVFRITSGLAVPLQLVGIIFDVGETVEGESGSTDYPQTLRATRCEFIREDGMIDRDRWCAGAP